MAPFPAGAASPAIAWNRIIEGTGNAVGLSVVLADGGYVITGYLAQPDYSNSDVCLIKTDREGNVVWRKTYGSRFDDCGNAAIAVGDGFIIAGETKASLTYGAYLIKTDRDGNEAWEKTYGGRNWSRLCDVADAGDGYVAAGTISPLTGYRDLYLIKTDRDGNLAWEKSFGDTGGIEEGRAVLAVTDGYLVAGYTARPYQPSQAWVIKTDRNGNVIWENTYGGAGYEIAYCALLASDGYIFAGSTQANNHSNYSAYLFKTDFDGNLLWEKTYSGPGSEPVYSVAADRDGYFLAGCGGYLVKTDLNGAAMWNLTLNMTVQPWVLSAAADSDGFVMTGYGRHLQSKFNQNLLLVKIKYDTGSTSAVASPAPAPSPTLELAVAALLAGAASLAALKKKAG